MASIVEDIKNDTTLTDTQKVDKLYQIIKIILRGDSNGESKALGIAIEHYTSGKLPGLIKMYKQLVLEIDDLNERMDANADNPAEHHARTMVLYGRKNSAQDIILGVWGDSNRASGYTRGEWAEDSSGHPVSFTEGFIGLRNLISTFDVGTFTVSWDALTDLTAYFATGGTPSDYNTLTTGTDDTVAYCGGAVISMPTIKFPDGVNYTGPILVTFPGGNMAYFRLRSGYKLNGWQHNPPSNGKRYIMDEFGTAILNSNGDKTVDTRVFDGLYTWSAGVLTAPEASYQLPFDEDSTETAKAMLYKFPFKLSVISVWCSVDLSKCCAALEAGTPASGVGGKWTIQDSCVLKASPTIRVKNGLNVTMPIPTLLTPPDGSTWAIDTRNCALGEWTTTDYNGVIQKDIYGEDIVDSAGNGLTFKAGEEYLVGDSVNCFDPRIRYLYLKVRDTTK